MSEHTGTLKMFTDLMKYHCCKYICLCEKVHLYCGFEMEHGIELQEVIDMIGDKEDDLLAALLLCLPIMEAHTEASHLTDGFKPRRNQNDDVLDKVKKAIEGAEGDINHRKERS